ncbi:nitrile hydratase subunit beta [Aurantimonas sp. A2-1-M11]|uniref:nitrile hydratase subunit beta n=1 Tax=Aurantimonas sp. A2-1-M11 TaxID=3113712 RepID=UPI002F9582C4
MDGIHDLGGIEGFGPVPVKTGDAGFRDIADWEKRMYALSKSNLAPGITIDWFRHGIERMVPAEYLGFSYFNKWCTTYLMLMIDDGVISMAEVRRGQVDAPGPMPQPLMVDDVLRINRKADARFETDAHAGPAFATGDVVRTLRRMPSGHTRLPRYARDRQGTVLAHHGSHALPDEGAKGRHIGEHLYSVVFTGTELWGPATNPHDSVTLDLWESYLVPA